MDPAELDTYAVDLSTVMHTARMTHVELNLKGDGRGSIKVDGVDWSNAVNGVDFESRVGDVNALTLHLAAPTVTGEWDAMIRLPDAVQEALLQMGWTPPKAIEPLP